MNGGASSARVSWNGGFGNARRHFYSEVSSTRLRWNCGFGSTRRRFYGGDGVHDCADAAESERTVAFIRRRRSVRWHFYDGVGTHGGVSTAETEHTVALIRRYPCWRREEVVSRPFVGDPSEEPANPRAPLLRRRKGDVLCQKSLRETRVSTSPVLRRLGKKLCRRFLRSTRVPTRLVL